LAIKAGVDGGEWGWCGMWSWVRAGEHGGKGVECVGDAKIVGVLRLRSSRSAASYFAQDDRVWAGRERSLRVVRYIPVVRTEMAVAMYTKLIDPGAHVVVEGIVNLDCR